MKKIQLLLLPRLPQRLLPLLTVTLGRQRVQFVC